MWNKITGTIHYDQTQYFALVKFPNEFGEYLIKLQRMQKPWLRLGLAQGGPHITLVKRETPPYVEYWNKYRRYEVSIYYSLMVGGAKGPYHWLSINPTFLYDIRAELGLPKNPRFPLHLSYAIDFDEVEKRQKNELSR